MTSKLSATLNGLVQTWSFRRTQPYDYVVHLQELTAERIALSRNYRDKRASLHSDLRFATELFNSADSALTRQRLIEEGTIRVDERERRLSEADANLYDVPTAIESMVQAYEAHEQGVNQLHAGLQGRLDEIDKTIRALRSEHEQCVNARQGSFFKLLLLLRLAS